MIVSYIQMSKVVIVVIFLAISIYHILMCKSEKKKE